MYEPFFNFKIKPFELLPNPEFIYLSKSHKRTMTFLDYGIKERAGFILLTGEIGSGKTTIIRDLISKYYSTILLSKVFNTNVDSHQLLALINEDFGLQVQGKDKQTLFRELTDFLIAQYSAGKQPVLVIDEAQNLDVDILEEIRLLSNLENDNAKLLQIILVGQPELRKTLASPRLLQLRQRININCHLQPLACEEVSHYILHRLEIAGNRDAITFTPEAFDTIYKYSRGIPRLINIICDFLLLSAFAEEKNNIDENMVLDIIADLDFENHFWGQNESQHAQCFQNSTALADSDAQEIKDSLSNLSQRIEMLEQQDHSFPMENIKKHFEKFTKMVKEYAERTSTEIDGLKNNLVEQKSETGAGSPTVENESSKTGTGKIRSAV